MAGSIYYTAPFFRERVVTHLYTFRQALPLTKGMEFPLGYDAENNFRKGDLTVLNHLLISGGSGFGKSVFLDSMILSLVAHNGPEKLQFAICSTKESEFSQYADMEHLFLPIATSPREISVTLGMVLSRGQDRLKEFAESKVRTISSFNDAAWENYERELPRIVIIVDDLSSVVNSSAQTKAAHSYIEEKIENILSMGRAAGIHFIGVTQTPTKKRTRGLSSLFLSKMIFCSTSQADLRFLTGKKVQNPKAEPGEALFCDGEFCESIHTLLAHPSDFRLIAGEVDLLDQAAELAVSLGLINKMILQGEIGIGADRAEGLLSQLEKIGLVSSADNLGNRATLISQHQWDKAMEQIGEE